MRYLAQRFVHLTDPATHYTGAASSRFDPLSAVTECTRIASSHSRTGQPQFALTGSTLEHTLWALRMRPHLGVWFGAAYFDAMNALTDALDFSTCPNAKARAARVRMHCGPLATNWLPALDRELVAIPDSYRERLLVEICRSTPESPRDWKVLDETVALLAGTLVAEGRDGFATAKLAARELRDASDEVDAIDRLRAVIRTPLEPYSVALVVEGMQSPTQLPGFGCATIAPPVHWPNGASQRADTKLAQWRKDNLSQPRRCVIATSVEAHDAEGARRLAERKVQIALDHFAARHRIAEFGIGSAAIALRRSDERLSHLHRRTRGVDAAYSRLDKPIPQLVESFRYAALARSEQAPVVQVLHRWIALEQLAIGAQSQAHKGSGTRRPVGTQRFLTTRLSDLVALHAIRNSLVATWDAARQAGRLSGRSEWREVETWLDVNSSNGRLRSLTPWVALLRAEPQGAPPQAVVPGQPVTEVAAYVEAIRSDLRPFAEQALGRWRERLQVGHRLANWSTSVARDARVALTRAYAMRNSSVHAALAEAEGADELALAMRNVVDAVLEVLPFWLPDYAGYPPWQGLNRIQLRFRHVVRLNSRRRPAVLDADRLTMPEGDGVTPATTIQ